MASYITLMMGLSFLETLKLYISSFSAFSAFTPMQLSAHKSFEYETF